MTVTAAIRDYFGQVIPSANNTVTLTIDGPARFENGKTTLKVDAKQGNVIAKINPFKTGGDVTVTASSADMIPGKVDVTIKEIK